MSDNPDKFVATGEFTVPDPSKVRYTACVNEYDTQTRKTTYRRVELSEYGYLQASENLRRFNSMMPTSEDAGRLLLESSEQLYSVGDFTVRHTPDGDELNSEPKRDHLIVKPMEYNS